MAETYDLKSLDLPRLKGTPLKALASLVEKPGVGGAIRAQMLANLGFDKWRQEEVSAPTASYPLLPRHVPTDADRAPIVVDDVESADVRTGHRFESARDFTSAYREGKTTPRDVVERLLDVVAESEKHDPAMRLFIAQNRSDVREQADASTERYKAGEPLSCLDGVPFPVKDEVDQAGYPTTVGTKFMGRDKAQDDATTVAKIRAAGGLLVGKLNMHELGIGVTGLNPHHGAARNPYDPACFTGGSSSGSAACVASGVAPIALAADGGGSIRIPAGLCGVFGLKPTWGRVSEHGAAPLCWSVAHLGPIGATAHDAALGYALLAGRDDDDDATQGQPPAHLDDFGTDDLSGLRVGVFGPWFDDADDAVVRGCRAGLRILEDAGATLVDIELPGLDAGRIAHLVSIVSEMATSQMPFFDAHQGDYALDSRLNLALGRGLTATDYVHAQRHRHVMCRTTANLLDDVDVIATPTTACTAEPLPQDALGTGDSNLRLTSKLMRFAFLANLTGLPAMTMPVSYDDNGMPVSLQLMGRAWEEDLLLRMAHVVEAKVERRKPRWHRRLLAD